MKTKLTMIMLIAGFFCADAQEWNWLEDDQLSYAHEGLSATVLDDSIFFSGGRLYNYNFVNVVDIYDVGEDVWYTNELQSNPRWWTCAVSCNGKVFFAGGNNFPGSSSYADVDIFDKETGEWTVESLSVARNYIGATAHGNKVFFAGGFHLIEAIMYDVIDIYDTETGTWDTLYLTEPKGGIAVTAAGGKVFFAGGIIDVNVPTDVVEIYDVNTGEWTYESLSEARGVMAAAAYGNKVYFAGGLHSAGISSNLVDIYDVDLSSWENTKTLSFPMIVRILNVKDALVFSGECLYINSNGNYTIPDGTIEIYYPETDEWDLSVPDLSPARVQYACAAYDDKAYYTGGYPGGTSLTDVVNVLEYRPIQTIHVPGDQPTIQAAIDYAMDGDTVLVDEGTYYENINFKGKAITVASNYMHDPDSSYIFNTIIDGSQSVNPDSTSVVYFISGEDTTSIIVGFTIQGGNGTPSSWGDGFSGGGIFCAHSGSKIENNYIVDNHCIGGGNSMSGGGMFADTCYNRTVIIRNNLVSENSCIANEAGTQVVTGGGMSVLTSAVITGNTIKNNYVYHGAGGLALGGGIEGYLSKCIIKNNIIKDNIIENTGNSSQPNGCGIYLQQTQEGTIISGNWITGNKGIGNMPLGGGIAAWNNEGNLIIDNNIIEDNDVCRGSGLRLGVYSDVVKITNNIIRNNFPSANNNNFSRGGGIYFTEGSADLKNIGRIEYRDTEKNSKTNLRLSKNLLNVIANNNLLNNSCKEGGGMFVKTAIDNLLTFNNIFYNNSASSQGDAIHLMSNTHVYLYHNNIDSNDISGTGNWEGEGNIYVDPEFEEDGYHLLPASQCIEAGILSLEIEGDTFYCPDFDIDGQMRPLNATADIGVDEVLLVGTSENITSNNIANLQIFPNPSSGFTKVQFLISEQGFVSLELYDVSGEKTKTLFNEAKLPGTYEMEVDLSDIPVGVYFCVLKTSEGIQTKKIVKH